MEFTIRRATVEDAEAIAFVHVESWRTTYVGIVPDAFIASLSVEVRTERWKEQFAAGHSHIFVAEDPSGIFGFASGGQLRAAKDGSTIAGYDGELYAIYLLREHQRRGAGRRLVQALVDALRTSGFKSMVVWALQENAAVSFYQRLGGIQVAETHIEIGGVQLLELAFAWPALDLFLD
jgi:ribosomal protein S18 acetylase RimI-like enzyme